MSLPQLKMCAFLVLVGHLESNKGSSPQIHNEALRKATGSSVADKRGRGESCDDLLHSAPVTVQSLCLLCLFLLSRHRAV